jgi:hypothetical protein
MIKARSGLQFWWNAVVRLGAAGALTAFLVIGVATQHAQAEPIAYTVGDLWTVNPSTMSSTNWLCRIDLATGVLTPIARVLDPENPPDTLGLIEGLELDPVTGRLYAITGGEKLVELDPATGQVIGSVKTLTDVDTMITLNKAGYGLAAAPNGQFYISSGTSGRFWGTLDTATGLVDQILQSGAAFATAIAIDSTGAAYGAEATSPATQVRLVAINSATGVFSTIGVLGDPMHRNAGLDFDESGQLWGIDLGGYPTSAANSTVFVVNTATAARSGIFTPTDPVTGLQIRTNTLAIAPAAPSVPLLEGSGLLLLVVALLSVGIAKSARVSKAGLRG